MDCGGGPFQQHEDEHDHDQDLPLQIHRSVVSQQDQVSDTDLPERRRRVCVFSIAIQCIVSVRLETSVYPNNIGTRSSHVGHGSDQH